MSYELQKPYTDKERADFIVEYNHNQGLTIEETDTALYALEPWEKLEGDEVIDNRIKYETEQAQKERERINMLSLTAADVERAIYKAKGMDFEDIVSMLETLKQVQGDKIDIDIKALKIELKANNFYRGNPYIEQVGVLLGFTPQMLDEFFESGDYTKLVAAAEAESPEETITENSDIETIPEEEIIDNPESVDE